MDNFLRCLCDEDLEGLIIDGEAPEIELHETWILILSEYYELRGDSIDGVDQWRISCEIVKLNNHLFLLQKCIDILKVTYSESVADSIRRLGYSFSPAIKEPTEYGSLLNIIVGRCASKFVRLKQLMKELEERVSKLSDLKPTRSQFEHSIIAIEEMQKVTYNLESLTVSKYILLEKKFWNQVEMMKSKK